MRKVYIKSYGKWFTILRQEGNLALLEFSKSKICYNIIGCEVKEELSQSKLF